MCYVQEPVIPNENIHHTKEWAPIASIFGGNVDDKHKVQLERHVDTEEAAAICKEIFVSGLATQPYQAGLGKFTTRFKPGEPYSATIAMTEPCGALPRKCLFIIYLCRVPP
jgi:hypothetical protein